ncbi:MAG: hypothetical protein ABN482_09715 [Corticimicrobacter sp.]|uniref:hypothetical protein n=1 Tax=Corticimicrobacter sp. TaxID=2678536 RepID=UPI0032DB64A1
MSDTPKPNTTPDESWGFLHPECHGQNALLFFSWDLARTIEEQFRHHSEAGMGQQLHEAQEAVDRLLRQYVMIQANPKAFEGQSIVLQLEPAESDEQGTPILALRTSPELEALLLQVQQLHRQSATSLN